MRNIQRFLMVLTIVLLFAAPIPQSQAATLSGFSVTLSCSGFSTTTGTLTYDRDNTGTYDEAYYYRVTDGAGTMIARYPSDGTWDATLGETEEYGGTDLTYNLGAPTANPITFEWISAAGNGLDEQVAYSASGTCDTMGEDDDTDPDTPPAPSGTNPPPAAAAGVPLPPSAVVARFTHDTPLYFEPRADAATNAIMRTDQTVWTLGLDDSGSFYRVMFADQTYWVPVSNLGTSGDDLWAGRTLPTNVVE
jgi:hypothetical protein